MEIKVPELGESITEGTISKWMVKPGDSIRQGDVVAEIETDKVNLELNAEEAGVIQEIRKQEGETVRIGEVIAVLGQEGATEPAPSAAQPNAASPAPATAASQPSPAPASSAAAAPPSPSAATGAPAAPSPSPQTPAAPVTAAAGAAATPATGGVALLTRPAPAEHSSAAAADVRATPAARKYAREHGLDLRDIAAHDPMGRVGAAGARALTAASPGTAAPAQAAPSATGTAAPQAPLAAPAAPSPAAPAAPDPASDRPVELIRMSRRRQTIATRLVEVQHSAAMLTTFNEIDMSSVMEARNRRKDAFLKKHGVKLGFMSFFTKAAVGGLKQFPLLNAEIRGSDILVKKYYDIGIAVSTNEGLVVPVLRNADRMSFAEIEQGIAGLADKARNNKLKISDLEGGTFTITNGGVFGSLMSTPILNPPQVGILGMHKIQTRPMAIDDERMENRPMMYVAVSYDHRIVDGKEAVGFLVKIKELLEDPEALMFDV